MIIMVTIYKNTDAKYANDTAIIFLENWDIRVDWSEYWDCINEYQWHDDELAFSIRKKDFKKIIDWIKKEKKGIKKDEKKCKELVWDDWNEITDEQKKIFVWLQAAYSEELWYRHIRYLCNDLWIETYDNEYR